MQKEPLVFLPGMMCDIRLFSHQLVDLAGERTLTVAPITDGETITEIAKSVLSDAPRKFALAGLSMGGIVAMEIMRLASDRVTRLALMDTNPLAETPHVASNREPQIIKAKTGQLGEVMQDELKPNYLAPGPNRSDVLALVMDMALKLGPSVFIRQSRALQRRSDQQATLRKMNVDTLVLCGEHDALCPPKRHELMAQLIPNAKLHVVQGAGHLPTLEQPMLTSRLLKSWLNGFQTKKVEPPFEPVQTMNVA